MTQIERHSHSIELEYTGKGFLLLRQTIPIKLKPVISISGLYNRTKHALANAYQIPSFQIKGKHKKIESKIFDRILFEWPGGVSLDVPDDCSAYDYKIILHYLEGLRMALNCEPQKITN